jgi:4-aminobutyrate aminotransferase-like enzyme
MGEYLMSKLRMMQEQYPVIDDVRGVGLMVATEFTTADGRPDTRTASAIRVRCLEEGLMLLTCGPYGNVIRWIPPLNVNQAQADEALQVFRHALQEQGG